MPGRSCECENSRHRAAVITNAPRFFLGPFRNATKLALEEVLASDQDKRKVEGVHDVAADASASLSRRWSHLPQQIDVTVRSIRFNLIEASTACDKRADQWRQHRAARHSCGDIGASWRVVSCQTGVGGSRSCPREPNQDTLRIETRRLAKPREPMPAELTSFVPPRVFELDEVFNRNWRSSRRGAAAGPSEMTIEHLRPLLDDARSLHSFLVAEQFARAQVPDGVVDLVRFGRLTALTEPDGGVRALSLGLLIWAGSGEGHQPVPAYQKPVANVSRRSD